jgi:hypothetical protein
VKERWLRYRLKEGMPHYLIAGKIRFRVSEVVPWLERHGYIERRGGVIRKHKARTARSPTACASTAAESWEWIGTFEKLGAAHGDPDTEARAAEHQAQSTAASRRAMTCGEYAERFLAEYERAARTVSIDTARGR